MNILNLDPKNTATVDRQAFEQLCQDLGIPPAALDTMEVRFVSRIPDKPNTVAEFYGRGQNYRILLCTLDPKQRRHTTERLNELCLHEFTHFEHFFATGRCYWPNALRLPHDKRRAEAMARAFARLHAHRQLIVPAETPLPQAEVLAHTSF